MPWFGAEEDPLVDQLRDMAGFDPAPDEVVEKVAGAQVRWDAFRKLWV